MTMIADQSTVSERQYADYSPSLALTRIQTSMSAGFFMQGILKFHTIKGRGVK